MNAPLVIFCYNRPEHLMQCLAALETNVEAAETDVFLFADGKKAGDTSDRVQQVHRVLSDYQNHHPFRTLSVKTAARNKGLAASVIDGVTEVIQKYGRVIVVEDDVVCAKDFLTFMNQALDFYESKENVWSIGGFTFLQSFPADYRHDVFLVQRSSSYAWATWADRWERIDWSVSDYKRFKFNPFLRASFNRYGQDHSMMLDDQMHGLINSWAIRFDYAMWKNGMYNVLPRMTKCRNTGHDGSGTHAGDSSARKNPFSVHIKECGSAATMADVLPDERIRKEYVKPFSLNRLFRAKQFWLARKGNMHGKR